MINQEMLLLSKKKYKQERFEKDLLETVARLRRRCIPDHLFWDTVAAETDAPVSQCVLIYNKLASRDIVEETEIPLNYTLNDRIEEGNDFSLLNVVTQPSETVKLVVQEGAEELILYVNASTLREIEYFRDLMDNTKNYEVVMNANREVVESIVLFIENNVQFPFSVAQFEKQFSAIDFLGIKRLRHESLAFAAQNLCQIGELMDFRSILSSDDCEVLLCFRTIVEYCIEANLGNPDDYDTNFLVEALFARLIEQFEEEHTNRLLVCHECQAICAAEIAERFAEELTCNTGNGQTHKFEYRLNILAMLEHQFAKQCTETRQPASRMNYFFFFLKALIVVMEGCDVQLLSSLEFDSVVYQSDICKKYKIGEQITKLEGKLPIFKTTQTRKHNVSKETVLVDVGNVNEKEIDCDLVGTFAFETTGLSQTRKKLLNSRSTLETVSQQHKTPDYQQVIDEELQEEEECEEKEDDLLTERCNSPERIKYQSFQRNFKYQERKYNRYMELKPHINERERKSLLREASASEMRERMEELIKAQDLEVFITGKRPACVLNRCFLAVDSKSVIIQKK